MKGRTPRLSREHTVALGIALLALVITTAPRVWAALHTPHGQVFLQTIWAGFDEPPMAEVAREGAMGRLISEARVYGAPYGTQLLIYPPYTLLGLLLAPFRLTPIDAMSWMRLITGPLALAAGWLFIREALPPGRRAWGYFFAVLAGGLGFLFLAQPVTPLGQIFASDLTEPSFNILNSLHMQPHVAWDVAGIALFGWGWLRALRGSRQAFWGVAGVVAAATVHPWELLAALLAAGVVMLALARRRLPFLYLLCCGAAALPYPLYLLHTSLGGVWSGQGTAEIQNLPSVLLASAFEWPLVALGARSALRDRDAAGIFCLAWLALSLTAGLIPALAATPVHRTVEGRSIAMGVLAAQAVGTLAPRLRPLLAGASLVTPVLQLLTLGVSGLINPDLYLPRTDLELASRMDAAGIHGRLLGMTQTMRWVVLYSETRLGAPQEVADQRVAELAGTDPARQRSQLRADGDDYLIWGGAERARFGPPPRGLRIVMRAGDSYLLSS